MSIDDVVSRMGKVRIRDRTSSSQRLTAAHHRDVNMIFETYTPSVHGTIEQFLHKCDGKTMKDQAFIVESASFRLQYDEWETKQDAKQEQKLTSTSSSTSSIPSTATSATTCIKNESTDVTSSSSISTSMSNLSSTSSTKEIHVRTIKYQRLYDIMGTDWDGLKNEWSMKCKAWNNAPIHRLLSILNASVLDTMAHRYKCKSGRWIIFISSEQDVVGIWKRLVKPCNEGALGSYIEISRSSAQASTTGSDAWKLAIWNDTYDDIHECQSILEKIKKFIPDYIHGRTCHYKSKITSFLNIQSGNEWNLPYKMHEHLLPQPSSRRHQ